MALEGHAADCSSSGAAKIYTGDEVIQSMIHQVFELFRRPFFNLNLELILGANE